MKDENTKMSVTKIRELIGDKNIKFEIPTVTGIVGVQMTVGDYHFRGQYDDHNSGIYGISINSNEFTRLVELILLNSQTD